MAADRGGRGGGHAAVAGRGTAFGAARHGKRDGAHVRARRRRFRRHRLHHRPRDQAGRRARHPGDVRGLRQLPATDRDRADRGEPQEFRRCRRPLSPGADHPRQGVRRSVAGRRAAPHRTGAPDQQPGALRRGGSLVPSRRPDHPGQRSSRPTARPPTAPGCCSTTRSTPPTAAGSTRRSNSPTTRRRPGAASSARRALLPTRSTPRIPIRSSAASLPSASISRRRWRSGPAISHRRMPR
jgi:hypothetical protein